jgi:hypothetical protein
MSILLKRVVAIFLFSAALNLAAVTLSVAEEKTQINTAFSVKQTLSSFTGQRVLLKTASGDIEGTVVSVGDHIVHIAKLSGKDFYDAVVVIDQIIAVVFRARG